MGPISLENQSICRCDFQAPNRRTFEHPASARTEAIWYKATGMSAPDILWFVDRELFEFHKGQLIDCDGKPFKIKTDAEMNANAFAEHESRSVSRVLDRAKGEFTNRLQDRVMDRLHAMHFARRCYICRTSGSCSGNLTDAA